MKLIDHYSGKEKEYQVLTYNEVKAGIPSHVDFISNQGDVKHVKITSVKTWKKRGEIQIGLKYGLYEYAYTTIWPNNTYTGVQLVREVEIDRPEFLDGEFPNYYEMKHNMTDEFIESHRCDDDEPDYNPN